MNKFSWVLVVGFGLLICSCDQGFKFSKTHGLKGSIWNKDSALVFSFTLKEKMSPSDFLYQVQFDPAYPYENICLDYSISNSKGTVLTTSRDNLFLFEPRTGKPLGVGTKQRIYVDAYFLKGVSLKDTGRYSIAVKQYMRNDDLKGIQALGIRIRPSD